MEQFNIDAEKNAINHNNMGVIYMQDRYYYAAIKEFQLAVMLNPDKQATAVYYANLANCYMKIGYPALAQDTLQRAVKLNPMNFSYYEDLAAVFKRLNILEQKLKFYKKDSEKNPLSQIMVGLIYIELGKNEEGTAKLHEFVYTEPDLIITNGVKSYINGKSAKPIMR
jgi:tetratricopeptide (TPR) repeat protein